jgi:transcriptional regulator with XRE-family HTH domain
MARHGKYAEYREWRKKGLTHQEIADKYGVSRQNVALACSGKYKHLDDYNPPVTIGEHMRKARERVGLSRRELGELTGIAENTILNAEHDLTNITVFNLICLADALKISIDEYIGRKI